MYSELRQDLVTGDWIVVVPGRAKSHVFISETEREVAPLDNCPFENPHDNKNENIIIEYKDKSSWKLLIVKNPFPALRQEDFEFTLSSHGPYSILPGVGRHDLLITRDHNKNFPDLTLDEVTNVFKAFKERYLMLQKEKIIAYVAMFNNYGPKAGATVYHPHSQIISMPIVPPDVGHSLQGSADYFKKNNECVHCAMIGFEEKEKERITYDNDLALTFAPYISRSPFELRIFPKEHIPFFEDTNEETLICIADALINSLRQIKKTLKDPDYNFFIHTAPIKNREIYNHYHWHIEIVPRVKINAGFEFGTGIDVNFIDPNEAAKLLK